MKFDSNSRERCLRNILVDMKCRLEDEGFPNGISVTFEKDDGWMGEEFAYYFNIEIEKFRNSSKTYDKFIEMKNFASDMFYYLLNGDHIEVSVTTSNRKCEFQLCSRIAPVEMV